MMVPANRLSVINRMARVKHSTMAPGASCPLAATASWPKMVMLSASMRCSKLTPARRAMASIFARRIPCRSNSVRAASRTASVGGALVVTPNSVVMPPGCVAAGGPLPLASSLQRPTADTASAPGAC
ncbi:Uncharacterised protein [Mycobacteroides abscessus subsp. abscessus]|nr:Uncharacterised protein [Mycobacteroides abscessus subsp. abscessus]